MLEQLPQLPQRPGPAGPLEMALREHLHCADLDAEISRLSAAEKSGSAGRVDVERAGAREAMGWLIEPATPVTVTRRHDAVPSVPDDAATSMPSAAHICGDLDPDAVRAALASLTGLGLPEHAAEQVLTVAAGLSVARATVDAGEFVRDRRLLDGVEATMLLSRFTDAAMMRMIRDLAVVAGERLLARDDVASAEELSMTRRDRWRARTKSAVAAELQAMTGSSIQACHDRVGLALAPSHISARAEWALSEGWNDLRAVTDFWRRARNLPVEQASVVAEKTLGPVPDGDGEAVRASREQFSSRLHRAVTAAEGSDAAAARRRRRVALDTRDTTATLDDDGTGELSVRGNTSTVVAAMVRVDSVARRSRHAGDQRTLAQLRADLTLALLVHGVLPGEVSPQSAQAAPESSRPGGSPPQQPDEASPEQAGPSASPPQPPHEPDTVDTDDPDEDDTERDDRDEDDTDEDLSGQSAGEPVHDEEPLVAEPRQTLRDALARLETPVNLEVIVPLDALLDPDSTAVAYLPGFGPISADHARDIAAAEGTTIHRLLTDPADGRCVERSVASYRPDAAMLAQLRAADRTCRSPGCRRAVAHAQPDHVQPWQESRWTSEANLAYEHSYHHNNLTLKLWTSQLRADRTMTFTTLFGRVYNTRPHDYRDYHPLDVPTAPTGTTLSGAGFPGPDLSGIDPDLGNRVIYAALAHRRPGERLADDLDEQHSCDETALPTSAELRFGSDRNILWFAPLFDLWHRTTGGAIRPGPPPGQPTVQKILHPTDPDLPLPQPAGPPPPF